MCVWMVIGNRIVRPHLMLSVLQVEKAVGAECVLFLGVGRALFTLLWLRVEFLTLH